MDFFNVSLANLFQKFNAVDENGHQIEDAKKLRALKITCSHQLLMSTSGPSDQVSFHGSQLKQIPSSNAIELQLAG